MVLIGRADKTECIASIVFNVSTKTTLSLPNYGKEGPRQKLKEKKSRLNKGCNQTDFPLNHIYSSFFVVFLFWFSFGGVGG